MTIICAVLCAFGIVYGSISYWHSAQKLNDGDGAAFVGYAICHNTVNVWMMIELYLYKRERVHSYKPPSTTRSNYRYDAISNASMHDEDDGEAGEYHQDRDQDLSHVAI
eukprot:CAMPEP_0202689522 /NCGR_PEP_ID=MMETSP1385-20130828/4757_1 /ASSEMBLY_ACC=CAM_ASM_000861 /TAXON_ID=933848 /ORGANISM="Elphidium margaritaceum" /LENGTH=108 /DNA_ID=CAMNT_0049344661 /DNA_START=705 /DNA_END=1031 /DNA_ORIENTATION=+